MTIAKTLSGLVALALAGLMTTSASATPFSYSVTTIFNGNTADPGEKNEVALGAGNLLVVTGASNPTNSVPTDINLANFDIVSTNDDPTEFVIPFILSLAITSGGETGVFDINGSLTLSNLTDTSAIQEVIYDALPGGQTIGGMPFTISNPTFAVDTVNDPAVGAFGVRVNAIPEPASLAMAGLGLAGLAGLGLRRRRQLT